MSIESMIENPSGFSLNNLRKNIKWNTGKIDKEKSSLNTVANSLWVLIKIINILEINK